jgi:hypothetical protein
VVPSHFLYLCTRLVSGEGSVRVAGKWCDLSVRGLCMEGWEGGMAGGALAGHQRFCSWIWTVHRLGGCFWRILHE